MTQLTLDVGSYGRHYASPDKLTLLKNNLKRQVEQERKEQLARNRAEIIKGTK